jgi:hypothetical protein
MIVLAIFIENEIQSLYEDAKRFPNTEYSQKALEFNRKYQEWLENQLWTYPYKADLVRGVIRENNRRHEIWKVVLDFQRFTGYQWKKEAQRQLIKLIGEEAYYAGRLPGFIPLFLQEIPDGRE